MKPFDEKFADNVREVFDAWHEPVDEQAWQEMKSRLTKSKKTSLFILVPAYMKYAAAAVVLLVASITLWQILPTSDINENQLSQRTEITPYIESDTHSGITENSTDNDPNTLSQKQDLAKHHLADKTERKISSKKSTDESFAETIHKPVMVSSPNLQIGSTSDIPGMRDNLSHLPEQIDLILDESPLEIPTNPELAQEMPNQNVIDDAQIIAYNLSLIKNQERNHASKPGIEFSAGSMKTYSTAEVAGGMGYSAGITGNWPLSDRFSIGSGGVLVYNQFSLNEPDAATRINKDFANSPELDLSSGYNIIGQKTYADVEYMAIDIPVNFRYKVSDIANGKLFVSAGLSSLLYLQQNYTQNSDVTAFYVRNDTYGNQYLGSESTKLSTSTEFDAFKRLDLGRYLNFSVGYMINREKNSLLVEPFIKYPLGDVTSMNLQIGMAGITLKYHFAKP
jgi:hypothetical protein